MGHLTTWMNARKARMDAHAAVKAAEAIVSKHPVKAA